MSIQLLPYELIINMIEYLSVQDILSFCQTNESYYQICQDPRVWTYLLKRDYNIDYQGLDGQFYYFYLLSKHQYIQKSGVLMVVENKDSNDIYLMVNSDNIKKIYKYIIDQINDPQIRSNNFFIQLAYDYFTRGSPDFLSDEYDLNNLDEDEVVGIINATTYNINGQTFNLPQPIDLYIIEDKMYVFISDLSYYNPIRIHIYYSTPIVTIF